MNRKDVWLSVSIILIAILLAMTIAAILYQKKSTSALQEAAYIDEIDSMLSKGATQAAEESVLDLSQKDLSAAHYIRLLKRAWQISEQTKSYDTFNKVAQSSTNAYPARDDLHALRIYGLLRSGRKQKAAELFADKPIKDEKWTHIRSEVSLYAKKDLKDNSNELHKKVLTKQSNAEDFLSMYRETGINGFLLDGLLVLLNQGKVSAAHTLVLEKDYFSHLPSGFSFQLSFDAGNWQRAEKILDRNPQFFSKIEYLFLKADVYMHQEKLDNAEKVYTQLLREWPQLRIPLKSRALLNLMYIHDTKGKEIPSEFMEHIKKVATQDPDNSALLFAGYFLSQNKIQHAQEVLNLSSDSTHQDILRQIIQEETRLTVNPERYKSLLWRLVYRTKQEKYEQYLAWFLLGIEDIDGLRSLVAHSRSTHGDKAWVQFYQAILHMYERKYDAAAKLLKSAFERKTYWEYLYNAALNYSALNDINAAIEELKTAQSVVPANSDSNAVISAEQIELLIQNGRYSEARTQLSIFENRFPDNLNVGLLRSLLEARAGD